VIEPPVPPEWPALALTEAVERRRRDPQFKARVQQIIDQDRELLERLAK
jgi:hypothetical protein